MKSRTKEELLEIYKSTHGNFYDYSLLDLENKTNGKIRIACPAHGEFLQNHNDHIRAGCPECGNQRKKVNSSKILVQDINDLKRQFGNQFDFTHAVYRNSSSSLNVRCKKHDVFFRNTAYHLVRGAGCPECKKEKVASKKKLGNTEFIKRSMIKHSTKYDYSLVDYKTLTDPVKIQCPEHGVFAQKPREHLRGHGCPICASTNVSVVSQKWLNSFDIELVREHRIDHDNGYYLVDGYDPNTNTVYEFYGDYWHGNPAQFDPNKINTSVDKKFGELYNNTMLREQVLSRLGYNLITVWESDFYAETTRSTDVQMGQKKTNL